MTRLIEDDVVHISGEIYTNQTVHTATSPLLVKVFVYLNPDVHFLIPVGDAESHVRTLRVDVNRAVKDIIRYERTQSPEISFSAFSKTFWTGKIDPWWTHEIALDPRAKDFQDFVEDEEDDGADSGNEDAEDGEYNAPASRRPSNLVEAEVDEHEDQHTGPARPETIPAILPGTYEETIAALKGYADPEEKKREVWIRTHFNRIVAIPELEQDAETLKDSVTQSAALSMVSMQQIVQNSTAVFTQEEILEACSMGTQTTILDGIYKASRFDNLEFTTPSRNMVTEMLPFQKQGLTWLKWRETPQTQNKSLNPFWTMFKSTESIHPIYINKETLDVTFNFVESDPPPLGGILADEMGMGKTAQILSLVDLVNTELKTAGKRDEWTRATLIVCTASVLDHWNSEIKKHFRPNTFSTLRYHGSSKPKDPQAISKYHVVFTTYDTLAREYADQVKGTKLNSDDELFESPLLQVRWRRVILDEAHGVRDLTTKKSTAVFALESERRWCLTGTPVQNSLQDLYFLIKFLRVPIFTESKWWNSLVTEPFMSKDNAAMMRLYDIVQPIMMRRLKNQKSSVDGQALLELPDLEKEVVLLDMTADEETFYNYLYKKSKDEFEDMVFQGVAMRNYRKIIELISKVRQACCHPYLAINSIYKKGLDAQLFYDSVNDPDMAISYLRSTTEQMKDIQRLRCPGCYVKFYQLEELECGHYMCSKCCDNRKVWDDDVDFEQKKSDNAFVRCKECNEPSAFVRINHLDRGVVPPDPRRDYLESTKVRALVDDLKSHQEKAVVFSQWVTFLDILEIALERENISFLRIDGSMNPGKRGTVIQNFRDGASRVLFVSIKSGNAGIDLQVASRAYIMEPWWNPVREKQSTTTNHDCRLILTLK
jgi:SNF2 family DNA or RNA helicase